MRMRMMMIMRLFFFQHWVARIWVSLQVQLADLSKILICLSRSICANISGLKVPWQQLAPRDIWDPCKSRVKKYLPPGGFRSLQDFQDLLRCTSPSELKTGASEGRLEDFTILGYLRPFFGTSPGVSIKGIEGDTTLSYHWDWCAPPQDFVAIVTLETRSCVFFWSCKTHCANNASCGGLLCFPAWKAKSYWLLVMIQLPIPSATCWNRRLQESAGQQCILLDGMLQDQRLVVLNMDCPLCKS